LSLKTKVDGLSVVWPQKYWDGSLWFGLKTSGDGLSVVLPQNYLDGFLRFGLKTGGDGFLWFGLKTSGDGFLRFDLKTGGDGFWRFGLKTCCDGFWQFDLKTCVTVSSGLASKPAVTASWFGPHNRRLRFDDFGLKITVLVSWFELQNQAGFGLLVAAQNQRGRSARDTR
jgi:hypothetical protein